MPEGTTPKRTPRKRRFTAAEIGFECCANCSAFVPYEEMDGAFGECHDESAKVYHDMETDMLHTYWPPTPNSQWCRKWGEKKG